jgi:hypothetical protein
MGGTRDPNFLLPGINNTKQQKMKRKQERDALQTTPRMPHSTRITRIRLHDYGETLSSAAQLDCAATHDEIVSKIRNK